MFSQYFLVRIESVVERQGLKKNKPINIFRRNYFGLSVYLRLNLFSSKISNFTKGWFSRDFWFGPNENKHIFGFSLSNWIWIWRYSLYQLMTVKKTFHVLLTCSFTLSFSRRRAATLSWSCWLVSFSADNFFWTSKNEYSMCFNSTFDSATFFSISRYFFTYSFSLPSNFAIWSWTYCWFLSKRERNSQAFDLRKKNV